jgi:hypothetical protein
MADLARQAIRNWLDEIPAPSRSREEWEEGWEMVAKEVTGSGSGVNLPMPFPLMISQERTPLCIPGRVDPRASSKRQEADDAVSNYSCESSNPGTFLGRLGTMCTRPAGVMSLSDLDFPDHATSSGGNGRKHGRLVDRRWILGSCSLIIGLVREVAAGQWVTRWCAVNFADAKHYWTTLPDAHAVDCSVVDARLQAARTTSEIGNCAGEHSSNNERRRGATGTCAGVVNCAAKYVVDHVDHKLRGDATGPHDYVNHDL